MNITLLTVGVGECGPVAVLETPCFPAAFYAGYVRGENPASNATHLWHRDQGAALDAALALLSRGQKGES